MWTKSIPPHELRQREASILMAAVYVGLDQGEACRAAITQMQQEVDIWYLQ